MPSAVENAIRSTVTKGLLGLAAFNRGRLKAPPGGNPFLEGVHAPMHEELTLTGLAVQGTIPPELDGHYLRIGPNPVRPPAAGAYHWFVGDGMVHGLRLKGGAVQWYRNRWVRSRAVSTALGEPEAPGPRHGSDTVNTNIIGHAGRIWALVEAGAYPVELDAELNTIAHNPFDGTLKGSFSAHPHRCPATGELHAICYHGPETDRVRHVVVDAAGRVLREEPIPVRDGPSIHDCALTPNHVLVFDLPVTFSMKKLVSGFQFPYAWNPAHPARVGLLPRQGTAADIVWCEVDPGYVFHPCNAFETAGGQVVVDVAVHDTMFAESDYGPDAQRTTFQRWTLDPATRRVQRRVIDETPQEFPRPDERRTGQPYRYAYSVPIDTDPSRLLGGALLKHDLERGTTLRREFGAQHMAGEFVFVPRRPDAGEDEGWLLGLVIDVAGGRTDFMILNADDFLGPPQAVVTIPHRVPPGFHGNWVPAG